MEDINDNPNGTQRPFGSRPIWDKSKKFYHWTFTVNGQNDEERDRLLNHPDWAYIVIGYETGPTTGTPHMQCFGTFKSQRYYTGIRTLTNRAWCEPAVNTEACILYCKKDMHYWEAGTIPQSTTSLLEGLYESLEGTWPILEDLMASATDISEAFKSAVLEITDITDALMILHDESHELIEDICHATNPLYETITEYI